MYVYAYAYIRVKDDCIGKYALMVEHTSHKHSVHIESVSYHRQLRVFSRKSGDHKVLHTE